MQTIKVILSNIDNLGRRLVKAYRYGNIDVQTPLQASPCGVDSAPIKDMVAVYSKTDNDDTNVLLGYFNKNLLAQEGEVRLFSTDSQGSLKTFIWLKNDGNIQLGGDADNAVRYSKLNIGLQQFKTDMQVELVKIAAGIVAGGGTYTPATLNIDVSASKINTIKTS